MACGVAKIGEFGAITALPRAADEGAAVAAGPGEGRRRRQEDLRGVLRDLFTSSGYIVIEAVDGAAGVAKAKSDRPDIILMDIQMPIIDGYEATRQIKADPNLTSIPIVAVSSFAMKGDEEKARVAGCDDYVTKPYSPIQLLRMVRRYLDDQAKGQM